MQCISFESPQNIIVSKVRYLLSKYPYLSSAYLIGVCEWKSMTVLSFQNTLKSPASLQPCPNTEDDGRLPVNKEKERKRSYWQGCQITSLWARWLKTISLTKSFSKEPLQIWFIEKCCTSFLLFISVYGKIDGCSLDGISLTEINVSWKSSFLGQEISLPYLIKLRGMRRFFFW